jgi:hypothetical protein
LIFLQEKENKNLLHFILILIIEILFMITKENNGKIDFKDLEEFEKSVSDK